MPPITISVEEAQRLSGLKRTKLYELIGAGAIRSRRIGGRRLVDFASLRDFLAGSGDAQ